MIAVTATEEHSSVLPQRTRIRLLDTVRGFSVISMVLFHLCYDLHFIAGMSLPWFEPPLRDVWRASISWTFLLVAGWSCTLSRNNMTRSMRYLILAAAIFATTTLVAVDTPISFGIIFCMGASTLLYALLDRASLSPRGTLAAIMLFACFLACLGVPQGELAIGSFHIDIPRVAYDCGMLSWMGFPGPGFASGDYYPLIPYCLLYLSGSAMARGELGNRIINRIGKLGCRPLEAVGRHPLAIYIAHQPIILALVLGLSV